MCAIAGAFGLLYPQTDIALCHAAGNSTELEEAMDYRFRIDGQENYYEKSGMAAMTLQYMQSALHAKQIRKFGIPLLLKSLYLFPENGKHDSMEDIRYKLLTEKMKLEFPLVFLDLKSGESIETMRFLECADAIVVVLPQQPYFWDEFMRKHPDWYGRENVKFIIGRYMEKSKYSLRYYLRRKEFRNDLLGMIPMDVGYMDAMSEGRAPEFFLKNQWAEKNEEHYEFIFQAQKTAEKLKKWMG